MQIFTEEQAEAFTFDVLDATKLVPEELVPVVPVGKLVLNRNPDNFFAETEQVAFCTAHVVPGHRLHQRPAAGRPHPLVRRHADLAARRAELPRDSDQRADRAGAQQPARRHAPAGDPSRPGVVRAQLARRRLSVPGRRGGIRVVPGARGARGAQGARQGRALRRSLHAGDAVLEQPDAGRAAAHHQRLPLRAVAGADAGGARADGLGADERRAGAGRGGRRRARHAEMPAPMPKVLETEVKPEVAKSPALSLFARPGDGSIRARRVAILVADGVDGERAEARRPADRRRRGAAIRRRAARRPSRRAETRSRSTRRWRRRRRCCSTRVVLPDGADAVHVWPPTAGRWSSSRTSTGTASRCWCSARPPSCSRRPAFRRPLPSGEPIRAWCSDGGRRRVAAEGVHRRAGETSTLRSRNRSAARLDGVNIRRP